MRGRNKEKEEEEEGRGGGGKQEEMTQGVSVCVISATSTSSGPLGFFPLCYMLGPTRGRWLPQEITVVADKQWSPHLSSGQRLPWTFKQSTFFFPENLWTFLKGLSLLTLILLERM